MSKFDRGLEGADPVVPDDAKARTALLLIGAVAGVAVALFCALRLALVADGGAARVVLRTESVLTPVIGSLLGGAPAAMPVRGELHEFAEIAIYAAVASIVVALAVVIRRRRRQTDGAGK
jgi:NADH:ubiquinone oxidoreductase subunit K